MKTMEAIASIDELKPNGYSLEVKLAWLSYLDGMIKREIIDTHQGAEMTEFTAYDVNTDEQTELLVQEPFAQELYISFLENQIDYFNGETAKYNNSLMKYQGAYAAYSRWYNRTHLPIGAKRKYW